MPVGALFTLSVENVPDSFCVIEEVGAVQHRDELAACRCYHRLDAVCVTHPAYFAIDVYINALLLVNDMQSAEG